MLNRDAILQAQDLSYVDVDVPEWGGLIRLRMLTAAERFAVNAAATIDGQFDATRFQTTLIEKTAIDDAGAQLFAAGDAAMLAGKSSGAIARVFTAAAKLNGLGAASTDDAEKNS